MKTLGEFIVDKQHEFSHATGELTALLSAIKLGAKIIHRDINKAGPVSYTHLDVYKRQGFTCPKCGNHDTSRVSVTRRVCGYLGSPDARPFNAGKQEEVCLLYTSMNARSPCLRRSPPGLGSLSLQCTAST